MRDYDAIITEKLSLSQMTRRSTPVPDPARPGRFLPNGQAAKRGLNRVLHGAALARVQDMISYKADLAGVTVVEVDPKNTSRRCYRCGHTAADNRKSQATFRCTRCGHTDNADINAARNIEKRGRDSQPGIARSTQPSRGGAHPDAERCQTGSSGQVPERPATSSKREPLTVL